MHRKPLPTTGHPTEYKPEFATTVFEQFIEWCDTKGEPTLIPTESSYLIIYNARVPTRELFCEYLYKQKLVKKWMRSSGLAEWAVQHIEFAEVLDILNDIQKTRLINNGSANRYSPQIAKMMLSVNHGMHEKMEVDNTHKMIGILKHVYKRADELERAIVHEQPTQNGDPEQLTEGG